MHKPTLFLPQFTSSLGRLYNKICPHTENYISSYAVIYWYSSQHCTALVHLVDPTQRHGSSASSSKNWKRAASGPCPTQRYKKGKRKKEKQGRKNKEGNTRGKKRKNKSEQRTPLKHSLPASIEVSKEELQLQFRCRFN